MPSSGRTDDLADEIRACVAFPRPVFLELMLTEDCNLRCSYCWERGKRPRHMDEETALRALDMLLANHTDTLQVFFFGGEPLLRLDLIRRVVDEVDRRQRAVAFSMTTNGTLLDEDAARFLAQHQIRYLLSLDGTREQHDRHRRTVDGGGSWDLVVPRLAMLKAHQPWQGARMTVTPQNVGGLAEGVQTLFAHGINQFIIGPAHGMVWSDTAESELGEQFSAVTRFYHRTAIVEGKPMRCTVYEKGDIDGRRTDATRWGCGAGRGRICVTQDGTFYGCSKLATLRGPDRGILSLGDVRRGLINHANRRSLTGLGITDYPVACRICEHRGSCGGGCYATNHLESGSITCQTSGFHCMCSRIYRRIQAEFAELMQPVGIAS